jgi:hypothetical protein
LRLKRKRSLLDGLIRFAEENVVDLIEREAGNFDRRLLEYELLKLESPVKLPTGLTRFSSGTVGPRTALVTAIRPSWMASGTSIRRPVTSPAAKILGAVV